MKRELEVFKIKIDSLKSQNTTNAKIAKPFTNVIITSANNFVNLENGMKLFADTNLQVKQLAAELKNVKAIVQSFTQQKNIGTEINFTCTKSVKILVGFFKPVKAAFTNDTIYLKEPELETNATADDFGQSDIKISNAIGIDGMPPVNVHTYNFKAGNNTLKLGKGVCLILGIIDSSEIIPTYDAQLLGDAKSKNLDWLFE